MKWLWPNHELQRISAPPGFVADLPGFHGQAPTPFQSWAHTGRRPWEGVSAALVAYSRQKDPRISVWASSSRMDPWSTSLSHSSSAPGVCQNELRCSKMDPGLCQSCETRELAASWQGGSQKVCLSWVIKLWLVPVWARLVCSGWPEYHILAFAHSTPIKHPL